MIENGPLFIETIWLKMELGDERWPEDLKLVSSGLDGMKWCTEDYYENWITEKQANVLAKQAVIDLIIEAGGTVEQSKDGYTIKVDGYETKCLVAAIGPAKLAINRKSR